MEAVTCIQGYEAHLACDVTDKDLKAIWYKDDCKITNMEIIKDYGLKRMLQIKNADLKDSGKYKVQVNHAFREARLGVKRKYFLFIFYNRA